MWLKSVSPENFSLWEMPDTLHLFPPLLFDGETSGKFHSIGHIALKKNSDVR